MADNTGAPWLLPYPEDTDLVRDGASDIEALAVAVASGLTAANLGIGTNVVQTVKTDVFTFSSPSLVTVSGTPTTITPSSTTSKILVIAQGGIGTGSGMDAQVRLRRGSTDIYLGTGGVFGNASMYIDGESTVPFALVFLDSPATTSATTYELRVQRGGTGNATVGARNDSSVGFPTSVTLIEVAA